MLGAYELCDTAELRSFLLTCQTGVSDSILVIYASIKFASPVVLFLLGSK